jgi:hypothetical protein
MEESWATGPSIPPEPDRPIRVLQRGAAPFCLFDGPMQPALLNIWEQAWAEALWL